jgi:Fe-S-cluster-containing hydrogenase component 2
MAKHLIVDPVQCTGCNACILTCSFEHEGVFSLEKTRIQVEKDGERADCTPKVCIQCEGAPCVGSCPVDALSRDKKTGGIRLDREICNGCKECVPACPYEGIGFDETDRLPLICDLCGGDPACVKFCEFPLAIRYDESA